MVISLPHPPIALHPNVRAGWQVRAKWTKQARRDAMLAAYNERPAQPFTACTAQATFTFTMPRYRDGSNLAAWLKAYEDGFTDAGIWVDDSVVTWLPPIVVVDHGAGGCVTITVRPVEDV